LFKVCIINSLLPLCCVKHTMEVPIKNNERKNLTQLTETAGISTYSPVCVLEEETSVEKVEISLETKKRLGLKSKRAACSSVTETAVRFASCRKII